MAYNGRFQARVTARCPSCGEITAREMDYRNASIGNKEVEILDAFNCKKCGSVAFAESRNEIPTIEVVAAAKTLGVPVMVVAPVAEEVVVAQTGFVAFIKSKIIAPVKKLLGIGNA